MAHLRSLFFALLAILSFLQTNVYGLGFILTRKDPKMCFYEDFKSDDVLEITYTVSEVGKYKNTDSDWYNMIVFEVKNTRTGALLANQKAKHFGKVTFSTHEGGNHEICAMTVSGVADMKHDGSQKVTIDINHVGFDDIHYKPLMHINSKFYSNVVHLFKATGKISDEIDLQIARQVQLESMSMIAEAKIRNWALLTTVLFVTISVWQIFHLRRFLVSKKIV